MPYNNSDLNDIYIPKNISEEYYINNFFLAYRDFVDVQTLKSNIVGFKNSLKFAEDCVKDIDVQKNLLFISESDISKYIFLASFAKLPRVVSSRSMNLINLVDVWWKNNDSRNTRIDTSDVFMTSQDILDDVLCLYVDDAMASGKYEGKILSTVVSTRYRKTNKRKENLISWIFYRGAKGSVAGNPNMSSIYPLFTSMDDSSFQIVELENYKVLSSENVNSVNDLY